MKVPKEVRDVRRPEGTVVYAYGDPPKYNVKLRRYWKDESGRRLQEDGETIGSIEDGRFVPLIKRMSVSDTDILNWGRSKLVTLLCGDILEDLMAAYNHVQARQIFVLALLRTIDSGLKDYGAADAYGGDYISVSMPGVALSKDTVGSILSDLGSCYSRIVGFMRSRAAKVPATHMVAVDGTLKSYESDDNPLSDYSRKALVTGSRDVSVMFAFDVDEMEPVCSQVNSGNVTDVAAFKDFMESNKVVNGTIVTDKGFTYNSARKVFNGNPGLSFIIPLRRDAKVIDEYKVLYTDARLKNRDNISCRFAKMHDGRFLYAFRDSVRAGYEEGAWLRSHPEYDPAELTEFRMNAGTITFVSNLEREPEAIYSIYESRWEIEVMFRYYKHILSMDETRVQSLQSVIGTEFVNFLSILMVCRLRKAFESSETLCRRSFNSCMNVLSKGYMVRESEGAEWKLSKIVGKDADAFEELGLINKVADGPKRGPGRPKGSKNKKSKVQ